MRLVGLMPVRNESYILALSARVALTWCDDLVILLHDCVDGSSDIVTELSDNEPGRVHIFRDLSPSWPEMEHRQMLLEAARSHGATHIALIDADEILTGDILPGVIRAHVAATSPAHILQLPLYNLRGGIDRYHANGTWGNRIISVAFADSPELHWGGDRFHAREPQGKRLRGFQPIAQGGGGVMHLWASSIDRCRAKHRLYKIAERIRWPENDVRQIEFMYNQWERGGLREDPSRWTYAQVPESWWAPYAHWMKYLDVDAPNWQDAECDQIIAQYGRAYFKGLTV